MLAFDVPSTSCVTFGVFAARVCVNSLTPDVNTSTPLPMASLSEAVYTFSGPQCLFSAQLFHYKVLFSERELKFMFAICHRPSVCLNVVYLSVTFVRPTQAIEIFGTFSSPFGTVAIC